MCGFFNDAWSNLKTHAGTAGKYLKAAGKWAYDNPEATSAIAGLTAGVATGNPMTGIAAYKATSDFMNTLKGAPDGNVKSSLESMLPPDDTKAMKTNQYRSSRAVPSAADGVVYGQATHPVWKYKNNLPDGITVLPSRVERVVKTTRTKKASKSVTRPTKKIRRKVLRK